MLLKACDFKISHIPGKENVIADFPSRRPINSMISSEEKSTENIILFIEGNETLKAKCVVAVTSKDKILKQVMEHTRNGWNNNPSGEILPYYQRRFEITIKHNMLLWGESGRAILIEKNTIEGPARRTFGNCEGKEISKIIHIGGLN